MIAASQALDTLVALDSWAVLIAGAWLMGGVRRGRRRRDEQLWRQWNKLRHGAHAAPGHGNSALGQGRQHQQRARRGLKAYVFWPGDRRAPRRLVLAPLTTCRRLRARSRQLGAG